jgi:hypothetical protein
LQLAAAALRGGPENIPEIFPEIFLEYFEIFQKISNLLEDLPEIQSLFGKFPEILAAAAFFFSVNIKRTGKSEIQFSEAHLIIV